MVKSNVDYKTKKANADILRSHEVVGHFHDFVIIVGMNKNPSILDERSNLNVHKLVWLHSKLWPREGCCLELGPRVRG